MDNEDWLDEMITEANDLVDQCNSVETCLEMATSVECMSDLLSNLNDANSYLETLSFALKDSIRKAKKLVAGSKEQ